MAVISLGFVSMAHALDANFSKCLQAREGAGGDTAKKNPWGYTGLYQMGVNYAAGSLCSNAGSLKNMPEYQDWDYFNKTCNFQGAIAKKYGITSYADFTTGPKAAEIQNAMLEIGNNNNWNTIKAKGLDIYEGQTVNGVLMTKETMLAMAHLTGVGGLIKTLEGKTSADANGATTTGYATCLSKCMAGDNSACSSKTGAESALETLCNKKAAAATTTTTK